jgi:hypothetical protein
VYLTNGPEANLFGVEPEFGCCTANLSQGWPKLALSTFMSFAEGIAVMQMLPSRLETVVNGVPIKVKVKTDYPFRQSVQIAVESLSPVQFILRLRIPGWAAGAKLQIDGKSESVKEGCFVELTKTWNINLLELELPMPAVAEPRPNHLYAIVRGPLVYSLPIGEKWVMQSKEAALDEPWLNNYEVFPTTAWNYGLILDVSDPAAGLTFEEHAVGSRPFSPDGAPVSAQVKGRTVTWEACQGYAFPVPSRGKPGPVCELKLIPYGCTNLRMTEMPMLDE